MVDVASEFSKPVRMNHARLEASLGDDPANIVMDPAERTAIAHETARLLMDRPREGDAEATVARLVSFADEYGLDTLAELWSYSPAMSLPGALWRLYLVRAVLRNNLDDARELFQRGIEDLPTIDPVVAGAPDPLGVDDLARLLDDIVAGVFLGDLAHGLERAASVARAVSAGALSFSWSSDADGSYFSSRSLNWSVVAEELSHAARLARAGLLS